MGILGIGTVFAVAVSAAGLPTAGHERGGVTFDLAAISSARFAGAFDPAKNAIKEKIEVATSNSWGKVFALPHANGGRFRVSARYRMTHAKAATARLLLDPGKLDAKGRFAAETNPDRPFCLLENGLDWADVSSAVAVPTGCDRLRVTFQAMRNGIVDLRFRDLSIVDDTPREPLEFKEMPMGNLDGLFAVGEGQAGMFEYYWRRTTAKDYPAKGMSFRVDLPAGIAFLGATFCDTNTVKTTANADGSTTTTFRQWSGTPAVQRAFNGYLGLGVLVKGAKAPGACGEGGLTAMFDLKGVKFTVAAPRLKFAVVPAVKAAAKPREYANGVMPGRVRLLQDPRAMRAYVQTMADAGVTWMAASGSPQDYAAWREMGITRITPTAWQCNNGFQVGKAWLLPTNERFQAVNVNPKDRHAAYVQSGTCPVTVYEESDFFRTNTVPFIREQVKGADGLWSNWEPYMFKGKGCMCDRCCLAFAKFAGRSYEEIKAGWPQNVMKGGCYTNVVERFRAMEHAKVVHTLDKYVREATGGEKSAGFIPAIAWIEMSGWWRPRNYASEVQAIYYAGGLRWMNPWGPYAAWESNHPYVYTKRKPLCHFFAAKDVRETVDADYPARATASALRPALSRPKLMALPQGYQCGHWLSQPEHIAMALDSYFFNGWEATVEYYYPRGYDARYWERFADATARAAKYEGFVLTGRRTDGRTAATPVAGTYASPVKHLSGYLPEYNGISPLQTVSYDKDGARIVAVFNFWQKGEAFFDLRTAGLAAGDYTIVSEKGVLRAKSARETTWTAEELAKGVRLSVGASRCTVFEIRPASGRIAPAAILTDAAIEEHLRERRGALEKAAAEDAAYEKANGEIVLDSMPVI